MPRLTAGLFFGAAISMATAASHQPPFTTLPSESPSTQPFQALFHEQLLPIQATAAAGGNHEPQCIIDAAEHYEQTMIEGAYRDTVVMLSRPNLESMEEFCCGLTNARFHYTIVDNGPSDDQPDFNDYICSVWVQEDPSVPVSFVQGNETTSAGLKIGIPPADPQCEARNTFDQCLELGASGGNYECVWWEGACHYEPPIECLRVATGPFCIGIAVLEQPFPGGGGEPGAILNSFNWTSGTITGDLGIVVYPQKLVELGESTWWSVGNDPVGWRACVTSQNSRDVRPTLLKSVGCDFRAKTCRPRAAFVLPVGK
jgi:hypothetical protein